MIKVLIADDVEIFRDGIKKIIEQDHEIEVIACACNGEEAVVLNSIHKPDIILMDINMPVLDGIEATRIIKEKNSPVKILILTGFYERDNIANALENGADGYLLKDLEQDDLIIGIKQIVNELKVDTQPVSVRINKKSSMNESVGISVGEKQLMLVKMIIEGKKDEEIANWLGETEDHIKSMVSKLMKELGLNSRMELAVYALKEGWL